MLDDVTFAMALVGFVAFMFGWEGRAAVWRLKKRSGRLRYRGKPASLRVHQAPDAADQLRTTMAAVFKPRKILSAREARVYDAAQQSIKHLGLDWRAMAQVSLGEVLSADSPQAYATINSKRVDILLVCAQGHPKAAIEYQGSGHYQGSAPARDAVKREALRRAGIAFIEIAEGQKHADLHAAIARLASR